jgi:hypothetical protein
LRPLHPHESIAYVSKFGAIRETLEYIFLEVAIVAAVANALQRRLHLVELACSNVVIEGERDKVSGRCVRGLLALTEVEERGKATGKMTADAIVIIIHRFSRHRDTRDVKQSPLDGTADRVLVCACPGFPCCFLCHKHDLVLSYALKHLVSLPNLICKHSGDKILNYSLSLHAGAALAVLHRRLHLRQEQEGI